MKRIEVMERAKFIRHGAKMVLQLDFSGLCLADAREVAEYGKTVIGKMPKNSVLTLTNVTNVVYDTEFNTVAKELMACNKPYVLAGAVVGVTGWRRVAYWTGLVFSGRNNLKMFDTIDDAKEWLVGYKPA